MIELEYHSRLRANPEGVWARATTLAGINAELRPFLAMKSLTGVTSLSETTGTDGRAKLDFVVSLAGLVPLGRVTVELCLGDRCFVERSNQPGMRFWEHQRSIGAFAEGCEVKDRLRFEPKLISWPAEAFVRTLFKHRHAVLRRRFEPY